MSVYLIAQLNVKDWESFRKYQRGVLSTLKPVGGRILAAAGAKKLEGEEPRELNVILEFPDAAKAQQWYDSEAYQNVIPIREASAPGANLIMVEGL